MRDYKNIIILINLIIILYLFNSSIFKKEKLLTDGQLILLELAPVDPRSLMQGDYMNLDYAISQNIAVDSITKRGYCIITLDEKGIGQRVRLQENTTPLKDGEYIINYTAVKWGRINIGAESYFFQEGQADKFEKAKYGGINVDNQGNSLLVGLYDENLQLIALEN
ncbi:MAG: GDYXXLXY domain-containing protein [Saprospiraceae bacterium]